MPDRRQYDTAQEPTEALSGAQAPNGTLNGSQALLTQNLPAGNGAPDVTPPRGAIVHGACGRWWTGAERSHASCCHETFSSLSAFDAHRKGGRCNPPASVGLIARPKPFGDLWGWPAPEGGYHFQTAEETR